MKKRTLKEKTVTVTHTLGCGHTWEMIIKAEKLHMNYDRQVTEVFIFCPVCGEETKVLYVTTK